MRALLAVALLAVPALAQAPGAPACARQETVPGFEGWSRSPLDNILQPGRASLLALRAADRLAYQPPLARPATPGTFGATVPLTIAAAGTYRIALGQGAWIDVVRDGRKIDSAAHAHGPECSGIAKIVTFTLAPGNYVVQLSDTKTPQLAAMVVAGS